MIPFKKPNITLLSVTLPSQWKFCMKAKRSMFLLLLHRTEKGEGNERLGFSSSDLLKSCTQDLRLSADVAHNEDVNTSHILLPLLLATTDALLPRTAGVCNLYKTLHTSTARRTTKASIISSLEKKNGCILLEEYEYYQ